MRPAGRGKRLAAVLIDAWLAGVTAGLAASDTAPDPVRTLAAAALLALVAAQAVMLARRGQTAGKRALGLRVVLRGTERNGGFGVNVLVRSLANGLLCLLPFYFLIDSLLIFREDRRCLHDLLAGTVVVEEGPPLTETSP